MGRPKQKGTHEVMRRVWSDMCTRDNTLYEQNNARHAQTIKHYATGDLLQKKTVLKIRKSANGFLSAMKGVIPQE